MTGIFQSSISAELSDKGRVHQQVWGYQDGTPIYLFRMENRHGSYVELTNYGASIVSIVVPDREGRQGNVVLGFRNIKGYINDQCYIGATIGRFANRIGGAGFCLDGEYFPLDMNDGCNTNHGGEKAFNTKVYGFSIGENSISFFLFSRDGDGGFPGNVHFKVEYSWSDENELLINYLAVSDKKTIFNSTNHTYFNLSSTGKNISDHDLTIFSAEILETNEHYIPSGTIIPVGSKLFNNSKVGDKIIGTSAGMIGVNDYYVFDRPHQAKEAVKCILYHPSTGRKLEIHTSYPGVQLYTGDFLDSKYVGHNANCYHPFDGLCLECQHYPDNPNHPKFPSSILEPESTYFEEIIFRFGIQN